MRDNFQRCLGYVLGSEGGFSNHADDAGGATQHGVIQVVYDSFRRRKGLVQRHVSLITMGEITEIYRSMYWDKVDGDELPVGIDYVVFDAAVNSGPSRAIRWLQAGVNRCAGTARLKVDENIGPATLDASDDYDFNALIDAMLDERLGFMKAARNTNTGKAIFPVFGNGWQNRLFGYLPKGAKVRNADGVDDISKMMVKSAVAHSQPLTPAKAAPGEKVPLVPALIPKKTVQQAAQPGSPLLVLAAAALAAILYGASQWPF